MSDDAIAVIRRITDIDTTVNKLTDSITDLHEFIEEVKTEVKDFVDQLRTEEIKIYTSMARYRNIILRMQLTLAQNELTLQKNINSSTKTIKLHYRNRKEDAGEETTYSASISQQSRCPHCIDESSTSDNQYHIDDDDIKKIFSGLKQQLLPYKKRLAKLDHEFRLFRDGTNPENIFATFDNKEVETQTESCACSTVKVTRSTSTEKYRSKSSSSSGTLKTSKDDKQAKNKSKDSKAKKSYNQKEPSNDVNNQQEHALNQRHDKHLQEETFNQKGNQALVLSKRSITETRNNNSTKDSSSQNNNNSERECHASEKESNKLKEKKHSSHVDALKDSIELEKRDGRESPKLTYIHKPEITQEVSQKESNESNHSKTSKSSKSHKEHSQKQFHDVTKKQQKDTSNNVSQKESKKPKDYKQSNNLNASKDCESHRHHNREGSPSLKDSQKEGTFLRVTQKEPNKTNGNNELDSLDTTKISNNPKGSNLTDAQKKDSSHKKDHQGASLLENNHLETSKTYELRENQSRNNYPNVTDTQKKDNSQKASQKESNKLNNKNKVSYNQGSSKASDNPKNNSLKESLKLSDSKKKETSQKENNKPRYKATHGESSRASERLSNHNKKVFSKLKDIQNDEVSLKQAQIVPGQPMDKSQVTNLNVPKDPKNQEKHVLIESSTHINKKIKVTSQIVIQKDSPMLMDNEDSTHTLKYLYQQHNLSEPPKLTDCHNDTSKNIQSELTKANNNKTEISNSIKPANCFTYEIVKQENIDETIININDSDIDSDSTLILEEKYTISPTELLVSGSVDIKPNLLPVKCESIQGSSNNQNDTDNTKTLQRHNDPKLTTKVPVVILENMKLTGAKSKPKDPEKNVTSLESNKVNNNEENKVAKVPIVRLQYQDFIRKYKERLAKDYNINMPTSKSNQNLAPENNSQSTKRDNKSNNTSNNNPGNETTSQSKSTEVKPNNSRRKRKRGGRSNNRACKKLKSDNTVSSTQQSTNTNQPQSTITNQSQSTITNQSQSKISNRPQTTITNQLQSTITNQSQSTITNQPQSTITNQSQSTITNQPQSTITNQSQSTITNQLQSTITSQLQSTIAPGLITYIPVINLDAIALHYQLRQNFSNGFNSDQTDLVSYLPPRDLLEPVKSTYKLNVDDITKSSTSSEHLPVNPIYKFIGEDTKKKPNNTTFKYHAVNEKVSCLPDVRDNRFIFNDEVRSIHAIKDKPRQYNNASQIFNGANEKANILAFDKEIEHICIPKVFDNNQANKQPSIINHQVKCAVNNNLVSRDPRGYSKGFYTELEDGTETHRKPYEMIYTPKNLDHYNKKNGNI